MNIMTIPSASQSSVAAIIAGTLILTANRGLVAVEHLDTVHDRLVSFDPYVEHRDEWLAELGAYGLTARRNGVRFCVHAHTYSGEVRRLAIWTVYRSRPVRFSIDTTPDVRWLAEPDENRFGVRTRPFEQLDAGVSSIPITPSHEVVSWEPISTIETVRYDGLVYEITVEKYGCFVANDFVVLGASMEDEG